VNVCRTPRVGIGLAILTIFGWRWGDNAVESLLIPNASGGASLEFFERTPTDRQRSLERFKVKISAHDLTAIALVYRVHGGFSPASLFAQMAADWKGWQGEFTWESMENELSLRCEQDRAGHVSIRIATCSGPTEEDWKVQATVMTEAGQLERIAVESSLFFGTWV
jgi:Family of unknown function (DUF6228)